ncbi:hypothetical protein OB955_02570 [Halobacteria archaeon AArc-m2/3/4]|uniref:Uncharacterized protein n=1 Tax=Natronoglomus mannanivorans TaxID=2979990 RepID=A0AAP2YWL5_9EURY|nr:hypothetical protein [Halobacteria archaeon AArc-xg1-1]MCU4971623.1 hypothetical protein [Halobacteria archaeon AArc-m2/3/4]
MTTDELTRRPALISSAIAAGGAVLAVVAGGYASPVGLGFGIAGAAFLALGFVRGTNSAIDFGSLLLFGGVLVGGYEGGSVELALLGTVGAVVAWDLGQSAIDLGEQLGREAETTRLEAVHVASSVIVGLLAVTVGYTMYVFAADGQPVAAVALLLAAAGLVTIGLGVRYRRSGELRRGGSQYP